MLVNRAREAGAVVEAIPGASALTSALSIAGLRGNEFVFLGFVPQKKGRETFFKSLSSYDIPVIFYESSHRIMKTLESLVFESQRENTPIDWSITVLRELTKMHEEVVKGTPEEVLQYFIDHPDHVRGEFVVMVA
jgi:16S rRNA (cytidine1402-2'-O)-methyltransferase